MKTNKMIKAAFMTALTAVSAYLIIPIGPVPISLQTFFVLLSGRLLGKKYAALSQLTYLLLGAFGLPIFSGGRGGLGTLLSPTGGFIFSFIIAAWIAGHYTKDKRKNFFIYLLAVLCTYLIGGIHFALITGTKLIPTLNMAVIPFLPGDLLKILLVLIIAPLIARRIN